jgi:hypothetical protein
MRDKTESQSPEQKKSLDDVFIAKYLRVYSKFLRKDSGKPPYLHFPEFCKKTSGYSGCKWLIPINKWGLLGVGSQGYLTTYEVGENLDPSRLKMHSLADTTELQSYESVNVEAYVKISMREILLYVVGSKSQGKRLIIDKFLVKSKIVDRDGFKVSKVQEIIEIKQYHRSPINLFILKDQFILHAHDTIAIGQVADLSIQTVQNVGPTLDIASYDQNHVYLRMKRPPAPTSSSPYKKMLLKAPFSVQELEKDSTPPPSEKLDPLASIQCIGASIQNVSSDGMILKIDSGNLYASFRQNKIGNNVLSNKIDPKNLVYQLAPSNRYFDHLVEVTPGIWGASEPNGALTVIDGWVK